MWSVLQFIAARGPHDANLTAIRDVLVLVVSFLGSLLVLNVT